MPFTFMIYPDEKVSVPKEGDTFRVTSVEQGVVDIHWGTGTHVELVPVNDCMWTYDPPSDMWFTSCDQEFRYGSNFCSMCGGKILYEEKQ